MCLRTALTSSSLIEDRGLTVNVVQALASSLDDLVVVLALSIGWWRGRKAHTCCAGGNVGWFARMTCLLLLDQVTISYLL